MQAETELAAVKPEDDMVLTIGVFDGVHLGHKHLLSHLKMKAGELGVHSGVVTFRRHPMEALSPSIVLPYLTSLEEKTRLIQAEGIDKIIALTFDRELSRLSARQFVTLLKKHLRMCGLVVGPDFALGHGREGNPEALRYIGDEMGFSVTVVPPLHIAGQVVSSTAIREALAAGDMPQVFRLAGRHYSISGTVVPGSGNGRQLGFPTANLKVDSGWAIPSDGVYATLTHIDGRVHQSMTNIGSRPTFGGKERTLETYILNFKGDLYGHELTIDVVQKLRDERRFPSLEALKKQITEDVRKGKALLNSVNT
jgi:riboflavin kinase/FMN adenylyltransferase